MITRHGPPLLGRIQTWWADSLDLLRGWEALGGRHLIARFLIQAATQDYRWQKERKAS